MLRNNHSLKSLQENCSIVKHKKEKAQGISKLATLTEENLTGVLKTPKDSKA